MMNEAAQILDSLLADWHKWQIGYKQNVQAACAMFKGARTSRGYDSISDIVDDTVQRDMLRTVDFHVSEIAEPHKTALYVNARNLATGRSVWSSPRLPTNGEARAVLTRDARSMLTKRLNDAGVL